MENCKPRGHRESTGCLKGQYHKRSVASKPPRKLLYRDSITREVWRLSPLGSCFRGTVSQKNKVFGYR